MSCFVRKRGHSVHGSTSQVSAFWQNVQLSFKLGVLYPFLVKSDVKSPVSSVESKWLQSLRQLLAGITAYLRINMPNLPHLQWLAHGFNTTVDVIQSSSRRFTKVKFAGSFLSLSQWHHGFWHSSRNFWKGTGCKKARGSPFPTNMKWYSGWSKPSRDFVRRLTVKIMFCTEWFVGFLWWLPATVIGRVGFGYLCPTTTLLCLMLVCGSLLMNQISRPVQQMQPWIRSTRLLQNTGQMWLLSFDPREKNFYDCLLSYNRGLWTFRMSTMLLVDQTPSKGCWQR